MTVAIARSGSRIDLSAPAVEAIFARDIAEHLAKQPMYDGATCGFYSKAQHSVLISLDVARAEGPLAAIYALLHHADEAFAARKLPLAFFYKAFGLKPVTLPIASALQRSHDSVELAERRQLLTNSGPEVLALQAKGTALFRSTIKPIAWDRAMDQYNDALRVNAVAANLPHAPVWGNIL